MRLTISSSPIRIFDSSRSTSCSSVRGPSIRHAVAYQWVAPMLTPRYVRICIP